MHLDGLIHVASLTNEELFPVVTGTIRRGCSSKKKGQTPSGDTSSGMEWKGVAAQIAVAAVEGAAGYSPEEWVDRYNEKSSNFDASTSVSFGEALKSLNAQKCYKKRLLNALHAISSIPTPNYSSHISVRQITGLLRNSTFLAKNSEETMSIQAQLISCLVKLMPQLGMTKPNDIFLAVQLPLLQKLCWNAFVEGGIKFTTAEAEGEFSSILNTIVDRTDNVRGEQVGHKRKRTPPNATTTHNTTISHLLEAADLAREGVVRAKHGAVIYIPTEDGGTQVIGRGYNHDFVLHRSKEAKKNKIVLHSEIHAVVDAIDTYGEDECFNNLFPKATVMIVELVSDYAYDTCHPCPKCNPMLRAVGIRKVIHTTPDGVNAKLNLGAGNIEFLRLEVVSIPLKAACEERELKCKRLQEAGIEY